MMILVISVIFVVKKNYLPALTYSAMSRTFNWGIIGPGKIAHKFAQDLAGLNNARLHAVASRSKDRAEAFARQYGANHAFGNYEEILTCPDLDIVYVATPHPGHFENTMACLEAGISVLCEKPLAMNLRESDAMIAAARRHKVFLMEAIWTRFMPKIHKMLEWIEEGAIGEVVSVKADFGFPAAFDPESRLYHPGLGGGALLDIGIYPAFLNLLILGYPEKITALAHFSPTGVDDEVAASMVFSTGQMGYIHATIRNRTKTEAFIHGTKGTIHLHPHWFRPGNLSLIREGERPEDVFFESGSHGYHYEAEECMRCLNLGKTESDLLPLSFSRDLTRLLDAIRGEIGLVYPNL